MALASIGSSRAAVFFTSYASNLTTGGASADLVAVSDPIDLGTLVTAFEAESSLGVSLSSAALGASLSKTPSTQEALQILQGCTKAAILCGDADWFDLTGSGLSLGGDGVSKPGSPRTIAASFESSQHLVTASVRSLRLLIGGNLSPSASVGVSGTLDVMAIPEPGTWAMIFAGLISVVYIARRRLR